MSIKIDKFNNEIIPLWKEIQYFINKIDEKPIPESNIKDLAYLRKITAFLSEAMLCIDADYLPTSFLETIKTHLNGLKISLEKSRIYNQNYPNRYAVRNIERNIEENLDNLLQIIFPFSLYKGEALKGLRLGLDEYLKTINNHMENEFPKIKLTQENAVQIESELENELNQFKNLRTGIERYSNSIFSNDGIRDNIGKLLSDSKSKSSEIKSFHTSIYKENGLKQEIDRFLSDISNKNMEMHDLREKCSGISEELSNFRDKIFGSSDENGNKSGGLNQKIDQMMNNLHKFEQEQQNKYAELNKQIENLLPGATSAGLSSAYSEMRNKFSKNAKFYGIGFYISLFVLFIDIFSIRNILLVENIPLDKGIWISLLVLFGNFAVKIPFIIPALWLVIFMSRRRSEAERLSQEYAHKEVLAKSYDSYKQQIDKLSRKDQEELLPILMEGMIKAISLNPAETLDKKHQSDSPISEVLKDKNFIDSIMDKLKDSSSKS